MATMLTLLLTTLLVGVTQGNHTHAIIASARVRPGMDYEISVHIIHATGDVHVTAYLNDSFTTLTQNSLVVNQGQTKLTTLKIPLSLISNTYRLVVTGSGGLNFTTDQFVEYTPKSISTFIQTDKAMYKPGQTVHFRVFSINPNLKVYKGMYNIYISDPKGNKIKQWINVTDDSGVIANLLEMSSQPVLGDQDHNRLLPKFEVTVELPPYVLLSDTDITATVKAKYTYGKPVKGTVHLFAKLDDYNPGWNYMDQEPMLNQTFNIDGESKVSISLTKLKQLFYRSLAQRKIEVVANVTEELTGITLNGTSKVQIYEHAAKISFSPSDPKTFKPGLQYIAYLQVQQPDGRPIQHSTKKVAIKTSVKSEIKMTSTPSYYYYPQYKYSELPEVTFTVPDSGVVPIEIPIPANASSVTVEARYDTKYASKTIERCESYTNNYLQLLLVTKQVVAGSNATFSVRSTQPVSELVYQIMSRGTVVAAGTIDGNDQNHFTFDIPVTSKMAPDARVIVYYIEKEGREMIPDIISFHVEGAFENQVSISMDKTSAQPGESVNIQVTADPQSLVNLLAVDQSVLLLKSGNDITQSQVTEELKSYNYKPTTPKPAYHHYYGGGIQVQITTPHPLIPPSIFSVRSRRVPYMAPWNYWEYPTYYGANDAYGLFQNTGVIVLTDANVFMKPPTPVPFIPLPGMQPGHPSGGSGIGIPTGAPLVAHTGTQAGTHSLKEVEKIRSDFPETWLWTNKTKRGPEKLFLISGLRMSLWDDCIENGSFRTRFQCNHPTTAVVSQCADGKAIISTIVPDTITTWVASAFAVNNQTGIGVAPTSSKIRVFRPFFVSLNLPYSVTRGEQVALQAIVFNYLTHDVDVKAGDAASVFFPIVPTTLGRIDFTVSARSTLAADAVKRQLLVEPEGTPKEFNIPILVDLDKASIFTKQVQITLPQNVVAGSVRARVSAMGDFMGPSIHGIESLLRMPHGCGEQNMVDFSPDVFVTNYLASTMLLTKDIKDKAINFMEQGYQRELRYQHRDGSFSAFGERDYSGSMWLTAYVIKTFHQAKPYIFIDDEVLVQGMNWMIMHQATDGSFPEPSPVHYIDTGGIGNGKTALTAFVLIALLENNDLTGSVQYRYATSQAVKYLESHPPSDDYSLAIVTYALQLAGSPTADTYFATLNSHAIIKDGFKYWHRQLNTSQSRSYWRPPNNARAIDIETTAYALMVCKNRNFNISGVLDVMKWIISQRNAFGGFSSTQDTVIALQSLSMMSAMKGRHVDVTVSGSGLNHSFSIEDKNTLVLQSFEVSSVPSSIQVDASGHGQALIEIGVFFSVEADIEEPTFNLTWQILEEDINSITLQTCASWLGPDTSGMAIQEVGLPSGFEVDRDTITEMKILKRIETENKKVILYFDKIGSTAVCITYYLMRTELVAKSQPVPIRVYDYYEPSNQKTVFYESSVLKNSTICSVCNDCENCSTNKGI